MGRNQVVGGFLVKVQSSLYQRCRTLGMSIAKQNRWELVSNEGTCPQKQKKFWVCWKYHLCQFREFWKTVCMCVRLPANLCPSCWVKCRGEMCQHMPGPSREAWNPEFYCMVITGDETVVWVRPKNQVTDISVEEPIIFHAHKKGTFAHMHWACSLVFWHSRSCTLWICSTRMD